MSILNTLHEMTRRLACARKRRKVIADLNSLRDWQLQDIGLDRGAIPDAAAGILSRQGCGGSRDPGAFWKPKWNEVK